MKNSILTCIFLFFVSLSFAQNGDKDLHFEVNKIYPPFSISKEKLKEAQTVVDLNERYPSSWVKEYISVEILTIQQGKHRKAISNNDTLTEEQKDLMKQADAGAEILVQVHYMPDNTLAHNEVQEISFSLAVNPESDAKYPAGMAQLESHLRENAIAKIPDGTFVNYDMAAVTFAIDEAGRVVNAQVFESSKNDEINNLLLETICNMPNWQPAEYADGTKIVQEFVLTVGNMENCMVNLLNIRRD